MATPDLDSEGSLAAEAIDPAECGHMAQIWGDAGDEWSQNLVSAPADEIVVITDRPQIDQGRGGDICGGHRTGVQIVASDADIDTSRLVDVVQTLSEMMTAEISMETPSMGMIGHSELLYAPRS